MADLSVTIGVDQSELEKGMNNAGKTIEKGLSGSRLTPAGAISEGFASGGAIGALASLAGLISGIISAISNIIPVIKNMMDEASRMRALSNATGISTSELQKLQVVANASGVGIDSLTHAYAQFNLKAANATIKGTELNNALAKMGVGMDELSKGQFTAKDGMIQLAKAYEAGTDAQTLAYYGNLLFGSSFEQLLPIIKSGANNIERYGNSVAVANDQSIRLWAFFKDDWSVIMQDVQNGFLELGAVLIDIVYTSGRGFDALYNSAAAEAANLLGSKEDFLRDFAKRTVEDIRPGSSKKEEQRNIIDASAMLKKEQREDFIKYANEELNKGGEGKKLNPFGFSTANAASQMQQMGGGDIFGAISFTPLDAIKDNTDRAANTLETMLAMETGMGPSTPENINAK